MGKQGAIHRDESPRGRPAGLVFRSRRGVPGRFLASGLLALALGLTLALLPAVPACAMWAAGGVKVNRSTTADATDPRVLVDGLGDSTIVWLEDDGRIYVDRLATDGTHPWADQIAVSPEGVSATAFEAAMDGDSATTVAWQQDDGVVYARKV